MGSQRVRYNSANMHTQNIVIKEFLLTRGYICGINLDLSIIYLYDSTFSLGFSRIGE